MKCITKGRKRTLQTRRGLAENNLAHLFHNSQSTVSRIFLSWVDYMYLKFGQVSMWANKEVVRATIPDGFKDKYSSTCVIIDRKEIKCQMPSRLLRFSSKLFSSYNNHVILKGLVGIAQSGAIITFTSRPYIGSISDCEVVERSGLLRLAFDKGDNSDG